MILDFIEDNLLLVILILCIGILIISANSSIDYKKECEKKGGLAVPNMFTYHCYTKEDLEKLRGGK